MLSLAIITVDQAAHAGLLGIDYDQSPDVPVFRERGETVLQGGLLYRDVHTETPPVINYAMAVPVLMGGSLLAFQLFFSACNVLVAVLLFEVFRRRDLHVAAWAAVLYLMNPFTLYHSTLNCQDEPLVLLFFLVPLALMVSGRLYRSALALGAGIWAKMWPLLLAPLYLVRRMDWTRRARALAIVLAVSAVVVLPFLVLCPGEFSWFLRFYLLGVEGESSGGVSLWHFLDQRGLKPPSLVMLCLVGTALLGGYWYGRRRGWDEWRTATLVTVLFFLFYPKVHSGYYLLPVALLLPYMVDEDRLLWLSVVMFGTVVATFKFADGTLSPEGWAIAVPVSLALVTDAILAYVGLKALTGMSIRQWLSSVQSALRELVGRWEERDAHGQ